MSISRIASCLFLSLTFSYCPWNDSCITSTFLLNEWNQFPVPCSPAARPVSDAADHVPAPRSNRTDIERWDMMLKWVLCLNWTRTFIFTHHTVSSCFIWSLNVFFSLISCRRREELSVPPLMDLLVLMTYRCIVRFWKCQTTCCSAAARGPYCLNTAQLVSVRCSEREDTCWWLRAKIKPN